MARLSKKHRRNIARGAQARARRVRQEAPPLQQYEKKCTECGNWKHVDTEEPGFSEFVIRKMKLASGGVGLFPASECRECARERVAEWRRKKRASGELARLEKEWNSRRDKEARLRYLEDYRLRKQVGVDLNGEFYEADAFRRWLRSQVNLTRSSDVGVELGCEAPVADKPRMGQLAEDTGISESRLRELINGRQKAIEVREADKLMTYFGHHDRLWEILTCRRYPQVVGMREGKPVVRWADKEMVG